MSAQEVEIVDPADIICLEDRFPGPFLGDKATVQRKRLCLQGVVENHTISHGAEAAGISRQHVYKWIQRDPAFAEAVHDALEESTERLETSMYKRAMEKDTIAGIFLLKKYNPEFRDKLNIDVSMIRQEIQQRLQSLDLKQLPPSMTAYIPATQTSVIEHSEYQEYQPVHDHLAQQQKESLPAPEHNPDTEQ